MKELPTGPDIKGYSTVPCEKYTVLRVFIRSVLTVREYTGSHPYIFPCLVCLRGYNPQIKPTFLFII